MVICRHYSSRSSELCDRNIDISSFYTNTAYDLLLFLHTSIGDTLDKRT